MIHFTRVLLSALALTLATPIGANPLANSKRDNIDCSDPRGPSSFLPVLISASTSNNGTQVTDSVAIDGTITSFIWNPNLCRPDAYFVIGAYTGNPNNVYYNNSDGSGSWIGPRVGPYGGFNGTHHGSLVLSGEYFTRGQAYVVDLFEFNLTTGQIREPVANQDFSWEVPYGSS
ncbi:hypothetical protein EW146_g1977 [Bondarzewia mesenterica]|uniref:Uncharacterized protein n=1 Tax=Bondarzewia mesenterica TaxID=1095465 RepID=A0A4S4M8E7_9AGAM|nr:hypothetical protein EW146_g1977 [Bondarzewia mesenterica]